MEQGYGMEQGYEAMTRKKSNGKGMEQGYSGGHCTLQGHGARVWYGARVWGNDKEEEQWQGYGARV